MGFFGKLYNGIKYVISVVPDDGSWQVTVANYLGGVVYVGTAVSLEAGIASGAAALATAGPPGAAAGAYVLTASQTYILDASETAGALTAEAVHSLLTTETFQSFTDWLNSNPVTGPALEDFRNWFQEEYQEFIYDNSIEFVDILGDLHEFIEWATSLWEDFKQQAAELGQSFGDYLREALSDLGDAVSDAVDAASAAFGDAFHSPLVFDLDGDGLELSPLAGSPVHFDLDNDQFAEQTGWVDADDGILVRDLNSNGTIDNQNEMFGEDVSGSAWDKLATYDTNNDATISGAERDALRIWRDLNQNGKTDSGELFTLQNAGVASINLFNYDPEFTLEGHVIDGGGQWTPISGGGTRNYYDVFFKVDEANSRFVGDGVTASAIDLETLFLPLSRGYGTIKSLHLAASEDPGLKTKLETLTTTTSYSTLNAQIQDVLLDWAGVDGVTVASGGEYMDGRLLAFLEELVDRPYVSSNSWGQNVYTEPQLPSTASEVMDVFQPVFSEMKARILTQSAFADIFVNSYYDFVQDKIVFEETLDVYLSRAAGLAPESETENPWFWSEVANIVVQNSAAFGLSESAAKAQVDVYAGFDVDLWQGYIGGTGIRDRWVGSSSDDFMSAGAGDDEIQSFGGDDWILAQDGADSAYGGFGNDTLHGGQGNDYLRGDQHSDLLLGGEGNDTIFDEKYSDGPSDTGDDTLFGGAGNDSITSEYGTNVLYGEDGADSLRSGRGYDTLYGGEGQDILSLQFGTGTIVFETLTESTATAKDEVKYFTIGTDKIDVSALGFSSLTSNATTLVGELRYYVNGISTHLVNDQTGFGFYFYNMTSPLSASDFIFANPSATITGTANADSLIGGAAINDVMSGLAGVDTLRGGTGDDTLNGGAGADYLYGQGGADTFKIATISDSTITGNAYDRIADFENGVDVIDLSALNFYGITSASVTSPGLLRYYLNGDSTITYLRSDQVDFLFSISGNHVANLDASDFIFGGQAPNFVYGTASAESLIGGAASEALYGMAGNDTLKGGNGHDTLNGGAGADRLYGEIGQDVFRIQEVSHSVNSSGAYDIIYGFENGLDKIDLTGLGFTTLVTGAPGAGQLAVSLNSGGTVTYVKSDTATNFLISIDGNHLAEIDASDFIFGPVSTFNGTAGNDSLTGGTGGDGLFAFAGDDTLQGGDGADTLIGGVGFDRLYGGAGVDHFKYTDASHSLNVTGQYDRIYDFANDVDKIDLSGLGFTTLVTSTPGAGQLRVSLSSDESWTYVKSDTATNFIIAIQGNHYADLDADDFIFG